MARKDRTHVVSDAAPSEDLTPKILTKQEFGRRVYKLMLEKGWRQSELARQADLPRDSISQYVRGKTFPTPLSLQKLAKALGVEPNVLLPNHAHGAIAEDDPEFEMKASAGDPSKVWVKVNRLMSMKAAVEVAKILDEDTVGRDEVN